MEPEKSNIVAYFSENIVGPKTAEIHFIAYQERYDMG